MISGRGWLITLLLAIATGVGTLWFLKNFEKREYEFSMGYQGEARVNPLLAAGRFLRRMGVPARELQPHEWAKGPPPAGAALLLATPRWTLDEKRVQGLLDWVAEGGHLIVAARHDSEDSEDETPASDALLTELGVGTLRYSDSATEEDATVAAEFDDGQPPLEVAFTPRVRLDSEEDYLHLAEDDTGAAVLHGTWGNGRITVLADVAPFHNAELVKHDHAAFLWRLVRLSPAEGTVWVVYDEDMAALPIWLWRHAPWAIVSFGLLLLAFLWNRFPRFGPRLDLPPPGRRRLLEHIEASGQFLWRNGGRKRLLATARGAVSRAASRHHPGWATLPAREQVRRLAALTSVPEPTIEQALLGAAHSHRQTFFHTIRDLELIRRQL